MRSFTWNEEDAKNKEIIEKLWDFLRGEVKIDRYLCEAMDETVYEMKRSTEDIENFEKKGFKLLKRETNEWCDASIVSGYYLAKTLARFT